MTNDELTPNARRQREFRERKAKRSAAEVRGIWAHVDDHDEIKAEAGRISRRRERAAAKRKPAAMKAARK